MAVHLGFRRARFRFFQRQGGWTVFHRERLFIDGHEIRFTRAREVGSADFTNLRRYPMSAIHKSPKRALNRSIPPWPMLFSPSSNARNRRAFQRGDQPA